MTRITLMSAAAALAFTPAAMAQYEDPDNAYMNESETRQDRVQRGEDFYDDDNVDTSGTMGSGLTNRDTLESEYEDARDDDEMHRRDAREQQIREDGTYGQEYRSDQRDATMRPISARFDHATRVEQLFHAIDMDGNGLISQGEWGEWQSDSGYAYRFDEFNLDDDNSLNWNEYQRAVDQMYPSAS